MFINVIYDKNEIYTVLMWPLLYILSYRTSVQLVSSWLSRLIVLQLSCNLHVHVGGGECSVHLDWILECVGLNHHLVGGQVPEPPYASSAPLNEGRETPGGWRH